MRTLTITSLLLTGVLTISSIAFAMGDHQMMKMSKGTTTSMSGMHMGTGNIMMTGSMHNGNHIMPDNAKNPHCTRKMMDELLKGQLRANLTRQEKFAINKLLNLHVSTMKKMDHSQMSKIHDTFVSSITPYLDSSKKDAFLEKINTMKTMMEMMDHGVTSSGSTNDHMASHTMSGNSMHPVK